MGEDKNEKYFADKEDRGGEMKREKKYLMIINSTVVLHKTDARPLSSHFESLH